jgi:hypothetical protein
MVARRGNHSGHRSVEGQVLRFPTQVARVERARIRDVGVIVRRPGAQGGN